MQAGQCFTFHHTAADVGIHKADEHSKPSMFKKLGGTSAIQGVVDEFYSRVFVDDQVKGFFEGIDKQKLKSHQVQSPNIFSRCVCCGASTAEAHFLPATVSPAA